MSDAAEKLQDALGMVDDEYILEAHADEQAAGSSVPSEKQPSEQAKPRARRRARSMKPLALAACLVLVAGVGAFALVNAMSPSMNGLEKEEVVATEGVSYSSPSDAGAVSEKAYESGMAGTEALSASADGAVRSEGLTVGTPSGGGDAVGNEAQAHVLTAAEWNDNDQWPFFTNLVNAGTIAFPSFGIDPRHRVKVTVTDARGNPVRGAAVSLRDGAGAELWAAQSGKDGVAYVFYRDGQEPASVVADGVEQSLSVSEPNPDNRQGSPVTHMVDDVTIAVGSSSANATDLQVMFIVDTTGSMADEIAFLQADFSSIAEEVGSDGVTYAVNFYRDEGDDYVTKCNDFTGDIASVQQALNKEYADGGGDTPEAVAQALTESITANGQWRDDCAKIAFLVFDAPPHEGTEEQLDAAVRSAAERGIRLVPVVASNAERETELFGRALAICTNGTYVFLTDDSGVGDSHLEPIVGDYTVESLHDVIVRIIEQSR